MSDGELIEILSNIKNWCKDRWKIKLQEYGGSMVWSRFCEGCKFDTVMHNKQNKRHCQLQAVLGNLSGDPGLWNIEKIREIMEESND